MIQIANQQRIWEYARLEECYLPYILATLADFEPQKNLTGEREKYARKLWFRCWFDSTVTCYDDLWTERSVPLTFFRAWYNAPSGKQKYPKLDDMIDSYESEISDEFLSFEKQMSDNLAKLIEPQLYSMLNK